MVYLSKLLLAILVAGSVAAGPVKAQTVAKVLGVNPGATLIRDGKKLGLGRNVGLQVGDRLRTDARGQVQIVFVDRTRIVVGPRSTLLIEDVTLSSASRASKLAVRALGGTYRLLTGDSPKSAYQVRTRVATMAVRGTQFDFANLRSNLTAVATYGGQVQLCTGFGQCALMKSGCSVAAVQGKKLVVPDNAADAGALLASQFPYAAQQSGLSSAFRAPTLPCQRLLAQAPAGTRFGDYPQFLETALNREPHEGDHPREETRAVGAVGSAAGGVVDVNSQEPPDFPEEEIGQDGEGIFNGDGDGVAGVN